MNIGKIGVWTAYRMIGGEENAGEAAKFAEDLGYSAFWLGGSPQLPTVRPLLDGSHRIVIATGIVNVWGYDPAQLAAEHLALTAEFPGRLMLGVGISHPEAIEGYTRPLGTMREFFDGLDAASPTVPKDERCVAALGPKMLDLSLEYSAGTHPYFVTPAHTKFARERLGDAALVAPEIAVVIDTDPDRARATARQYAKLYLGLQNYTNNLLRFEFTVEDIANGGSDRLIDAVVPQGSPEQIAESVQAHLDAGANHVCVQTLGEAGIPRESWTALAKVLL